MPELLKPAEYAEYRRENGLRGITRQIVSKWIKEGIICKESGALVQNNGKTYVNPAIADREIEKNTDLAKVRAKQNQPETVRATRLDDEASQTTNLTRERTRVVSIKAARDSLELQQLAGTLLDKNTAERQIFTAGKLFQSQIDGFGSKMAPRLAAMTDPNLIAKALNDELSTMVREIKRRLRRAMNAAGNQISSPHGPGESVPSPDRQSGAPPGHNL